MKITSCVPLPGPGTVARFGALVAVMDGPGPGDDPLLSALAEVAGTTGDGRDLVRMAARAALGWTGRPAWACAGVTADGGVAVLVHGQGTATVQTEDGQQVTLTASDSVIPVSRTFAGPAVTLVLAAGNTAPPDPRFWLGGGVVPGGGLVVTVSAGVPGPRVTVPDAGPALNWPDAPATSAAASAVAPAAPQAGSLTSAFGSGAQSSVREDRRLPDNDPEGGGPESNPQTRATPGSREDRYPAPAGPAAWHPPTADTPAVPSPATPAVPSPATPAAAGPATPAAAGPITPAADEAGDSPPPVLVEGALCPREHFNDPQARVCRQCGAGLDQPPRNLQRRPRPPLGVLVFDDGTKLALDGDYVLGREPVLDGEVMAGRARPVRISDPEGTVSRLHLRVSLHGWQVEVSDLGSANGSVLQAAGQERTLAPFEPAVLEPGAWVGIGHRSMQYLSYQGVLP